MLTIPNILTLSRIFVIPVLILCFYLKQPLGSHIAFTLFTLAAITDFFDGYLARATGSVSRVGRFLDPIADKLMVGAVLIGLVAVDWIEGIHVIAAVIIMCREILVSGLREFLAELSVGVPVTIAAKWKTTIQMVALASLTWTTGGAELGLPTAEIGLILLWLASALTFYTGIDYLRVGIRHMVDK